MAGFIEKQIAELLAVKEFWVFDDPSELSDNATSSTVNREAHPVASSTAFTGSKAIQIVFPGLVCFLPTHNENDATKYIPPETNLITLDTDGKTLACINEYDTYFAPSSIYPSPTSSLSHRPESSQSWMGTVMFQDSSVRGPEVTGDQCQSQFTPSLCTASLPQRLSIIKLASGTSMYDDIMAHQGKPRKYFILQGSSTTGTPGRPQAIAFTEEHLASSKEREYIYESIQRLGMPPPASKDQTSAEQWWATKPSINIQVEFKPVNDVIP